MKKIRKYTLKLTKNRSKSANGYAAFMALCCFILLIQLMIFASLYTKEKALLYGCQKQSQIDLNVISAAKEIIVHNQFVSRCHRPEEERILKKHIKFKDMDLYFTDGKTYLECTYYKNGKKYICTIYYDDHAIVSMELK